MWFHLYPIPTCLGIKDLFVVVVGGGGVETVGSIQVVYFLIVSG
jgi:hypothetical protein